jgi:hypothetical protein
MATILTSHNTERNQKQDWLKEFKKKFESLRILKQCPLDEWYGYIKMLGEDIEDEDVGWIYTFSPVSRPVYKGVVILLLDEAQSAILSVCITDDEFSVQRAGPDIFYTAPNSPLAFVKQAELEEKSFSYISIDSYEEAFGVMAAFCRWRHHVSVQGRDFEDLKPSPGDISPETMVNSKMLKELDDYLSQPAPMPPT